MVKRGRERGGGLFKIRNQNVVFRINEKQIAFHYPP